MTVYPVIPGALFIAGHSRKLTLPLRAALIEHLRLRHVVNLWREADVEWVNHGVSYTHAPVPDGKSIPPALLDLVPIVAQQVQRGEPTLIQCHGGRNRSGLLAGLVLRDLGTADPVTVIRAARGPSALNNAAFAAYLGG